MNKDQIRSLTKCLILGHAMNGEAYRFKGSYNQEEKQKLEEFLLASNKFIKYFEKKLSKQNTEKIEDRNEDIADILNFIFDNNANLVILKQFIGEFVAGNVKIMDDSGNLIDIK